MVSPENAVHIYTSHMYRIGIERSWLYAVPDAQEGSAVTEALSGALRLGGVFKAAWGIIQWLLVLAFVFLAFGLIYYFAPNVH